MMTETDVKLFKRIERYLNAPLYVPFSMRAMRAMRGQLWTSCGGLSELVNSKGLISTVPGYRIINQLYISGLTLLEPNL